MIVVCSGAKIILDLPATREWLETHSLTVVGFGCDEMPAFYSRASMIDAEVEWKRRNGGGTLFRLGRAMT